MPVYTDTLRMSGIDPYHSRYNPHALDDFDTENLKHYDTKYCILSIESLVLADAQYYLKQVNDAWKEMTGKETDYADLTGFLEHYINSEGSDLEDVKDRLIEECKEYLEEYPKEKEGEQDD